MAYLRLVENLSESISVTGLWNGKIAYVFNLMGRRAGFTSSTLLNDVKEFDNAVAEMPELSANTLDIISSSASDTNAAGTGVRKVKVVYINSSNNMVESADINLNGTTLVTSVLTGVNGILWMEATEVGSNLKAVGNIRLRINGGVVEVEQISIGCNKSLSARFMVPTGYTAYINSWRCHALNADQDLRIRATVNTLDRSISTVYHFQATTYLSLNTNSQALILPMLKFPALSKIRVATISSATGATNRADTNFSVILVQN